jgi:UDP-N-acetylglucosamine diphosphorylase / glucose-1-phosphate thymidylyltransferase / UDP-N-acetylgalactosamine diphosphorylase / glucosamine-1-phosphate N-acetyltransferase / galactosamine-1-phosphate N-acetyltransferase
MTEFNPSYFFELSGYRHSELFRDVNFIWDAFSKMKAYFKKHTLGNISVDIPEGAFLVNPDEISIGKGSVVEPGAYIKGPCIIGENCTIRHGAYIRGDVITGDRCVIGHDSELKGSILLNDAHAAHFAYVGDTMLGNQVNLGAGTKCANLKLDNSPVVIVHEGQRFPTGLRKFGAIIGDGSQLGCNSVTNPGTLIGRNVLCYPCLNFGGVIPSGNVVKSDIKISFSPKKH